MWGLNLAASHLVPHEQFSRGHCTAERFFMISSYRHIITPSYDRMTISPYHHIIITSYHYIGISSYHRTISSHHDIVISSYQQPKMPEIYARHFSKNLDKRPGETSICKESRYKSRDDRLNSPKRGMSHFGPATFSNAVIQGG